MREIPKSIGPVGGAGGGGVMWVADKYGWQLPTWLTLLVAVVGGLGVLWTVVVGARYAWHVVNDWREKRGGERLGLQDGILIACMVCAAVLLLVGAGAYAWTPATAKTSGEALHKPDIAPAKPQREFLKNIALGGDSVTPLMLFAGVASTVDRLRIVIEVQTTSPMAGPQFLPMPPIQIKEYRDLVRGGNLNVQLVFKAEPPAPTGEYFWGDPALNYPTSSLNRVRVVVIGPDNTEQHAYFLVIRGLKNQLFTVVSEQEHHWIDDWKTKGS